MLKHIDHINHMKIKHLCSLCTYVFNFLLRHQIEKMNPSLGIFHHPGYNWHNI